jgi:hypothetical protein
MVRNIFWLIVLAAVCAPARAVVTHKAERIELDWSKMRIRFYGQVSATGNKSLQAMTDRALKEGLLYFVNEFPKIRAQRLGRSPTEADAAIAHRVASATFIANTTLFANGEIRVDLESSLARAMAHADGNFRRESVSDLPRKNSAIVLELDQAIAPMPTYTVVATASEETLFESRDVAKEAFAKNLMGRWFNSAGSRSYQSFVGLNPVRLRGKVQGQQIAVDKNQWRQIKRDNPGLLEEAQIAVLLPSS